VSAVQCLPFNASPDLYRLQTFRPNFSRPALLLKFFIPNFEILFQIPILYIEKAGGADGKKHPNWYGNVRQRNALFTPSAWEKIRITS